MTIAPPRTRTTRSTTPPVGDGMVTAARPSLTPANPSSAYGGLSPSVLPVSKVGIVAAPVASSRHSSPPATISQTLPAVSVNNSSWPPSSLHSGCPVAAASARMVLT